MKRMMSITTLCLASLLPAVASAEEGNLNSSLRGLYAFTGDAVCITSSASPGTRFKGFFANDPAYSLSQSVEGVRRFNGDGTGTIVSGRAISITHARSGLPTPPIAGLGPVTVGTFTADFTYTVARDRSIHMDVGVLTGIQTVGPHPGATEKWTGIKVDGHVSQDFKTIVVATASDPSTSPKLVLEFGYHTSGQIDTNMPPDETRACHRSRVMVKISGGPERDDQPPVSPMSPFSR